MIKTFFTVNFGCRANLAESQEISRFLEKKGYYQKRINPDTYIVNTCAVTESAEKEAKQLINGLRKKFPNTEIICSGCAVTKWISENKKIPKTINVPNTEKDKIPGIINKLKTKTENLSTEEREPLDLYLRSGRIFIKIQDGCDHYCSFCLVPFVRGSPRSKTIFEVVEEINSWSNLAKEVILTSINSDLYGKDQKESFPELIKKIASLTLVPRVSFGSINPLTLNKNFVNSWENLGERRVNYLHLPIQSGSDDVLKSMNRGYLLDDIKEKINSLKKLDKLFFFGTDILVGFPGETEKDFKKTIEYLDESPFCRFHVFRFSLRTGTLAEKIIEKNGEVCEEIKERRSRAIRLLGKRKMLNFLRKHVAKEFKALVLVRLTEGWREVLLSNQVVAYVKAGNKDIGQIRNVKINQLTGEKLLGRLI